LISGGSDKVIYAFDPFLTDSIAWKLEGHKENVCTLTVSPDGKIISGSWDRYENLFCDSRLFLQIFWK
jgi:phospholipase A-2-activating protein